MKTILRSSITIILLGLIFYVLPCKIMEIITLLAVLVALFRDDLYSFFIPPDLVITASSGSSHFHDAPVTNQLTGHFVENQAWFGVIVENHGLGTAKNIQLVFNGLQSNRVPNIDRFRSLPLIRSWIHSPVVNAIHKSTPIRFDICYIRQSQPDFLHFSFFSTPNALTAVPCSQPDESFFEFEVVAISENAPLAKKRVRITYNGKYIQGFKVS